MKRNRNDIGATRWFIELTVALIELILTGSPITLILLTADSKVKKARIAKSRGARVIGKIAELLILVANALLMVIPFIG